MASLSTAVGPDRLSCVQTPPVTTETTLPLPPGGTAFSCSANALRCSEEVEVQVKKQPHERRPGRLHVDPMALFAAFPTFQRFTPAFVPAV